MDAQILLLFALARPLHDRAWLLAHDTELLNEAQQHRWDQALQRRLRGEPVAYITGHKDFFGLTLNVDARVLDPRPDTEILVEWALALLPAGQADRVLDLGTGSGAIALAIKSSRPDVDVHARDFSADALQVARANAARLGLGIHFSQGSWFTDLPDRYSVVVSNPPYIAEQDSHLPALRHEPIQALTSGADGLDDIRQIIAGAGLHLQSGGWLLLEHGHDQSDAVCALLTAAGLKHAQSRTDLTGTLRCSGAQFLAGHTQT